MKCYLAVGVCLFPLTSLAQAPLPGRTYLAQMGSSCAKTTTGGCWETFYYRLRFGTDSVTATYIVQSVRSNRGEATTTRTDTTQTQRYAYHALNQPPQVAIPGFVLGTLTPAAGGNLLSQLPLNRGGGQVVFKPNAVLPRPGN